MAVLELSSNQLFSFLSKDLDIISEDYFVALWFIKKRAWDIPLSGSQSAFVAEI